MIWIWIYIIDIKWETKSEEATEDPEEAQTDTLKKEETLAVLTILPPADLSGSTIEIPEETLTLDPTTPTADLLTTPTTTTEDPTTQSILDPTQTEGLLSVN